MEWSDPGIMVAAGGAVGAVLKTLADHLSGAKAERTRQRELKAIENHELNIDRHELSKEQRNRIVYLEKTLNETILMNHDTIEKFRDREDACQSRCTDLAIRLAQMEGEHKVLMTKFSLLEKAIAAQILQRDVDRSESAMAQLHAAVVMGSQKADNAFQKADVALEHANTMNEKILAGVEATANLQQQVTDNKEGK